MEEYISAYLCEQRDLHPVSPNFALCAICLWKVRKLSVKNVCAIFSDFNKDNPKK